MKATKKIWKGIAGKLKNRKGSQITTNSEGSAIEEPRTTPEDVEDDSLEVKGTTSVIETDIQLCEDINESSEDFKPIFENREKVQNVSTEQEPNTSNDLPSAEIKPCDAVEEKSSTKAIQQKQAILAGNAGVVLLVGSVASYIMKMYIIAVVGGVIG